MEHAAPTPMSDDAAGGAGAALGCDRREAPISSVMAERTSARISSRIPVGSKVDRGIGEHLACIHSGFGRVVC